MSKSEPNYHEPVAPATLARIASRELLIEHLGTWPTFHDFEVLSLTADRPTVMGSACDLRATFLVFDITKPHDDPERRQGTVELFFEQIDGLLIEGFNHQNPIVGLAITHSEDSDLFQVAWGGSGLLHEVRFTCRRISVLRVVDLNPFRRSLTCF